MEKAPSSSAGLTWSQKLAYLITRLPKTRDQLFGLMREARAAELVDDDTLQMMERVVEVSDLQVEQVMVSRGQMITVDVNQNLSLIHI